MPISNWTYNYSLFAHKDFDWTWAAENKVEFIPMMPYRRVYLDTDKNKCYMDPEEAAASSKKRLCSVEDLTTAL